MTKLWGSEQPIGFHTHLITLAIYKDLTGYGYQKVLDLIDLGFVISSVSFRHNTRIIRWLLYKWGIRQIGCGDCEDWDQVKHVLPKKKGLEKVNLMMDSSDLR
jgi:hypothetical protein